MRLKLYSPDGQRIRRLKNWLLRCHACYATTKQMDKRFCPKCGGPTLLRTSYSVDTQGRLTLHLRSDFQYRLRGTQYSLPMPKGGRNANNLVLREDQLEHERAQKSYERSQRKAAKGVSIDVIDDRLSSIFGGMSIGTGRTDGTAKAYFDGVAPPTIGFGRKNPNEARRSRK
jgi:RNA-binding protein NOB1